MREKNKKKKRDEEKNVVYHVYRRRQATMKCALAPSGGNSEGVGMTFDKTRQVKKCALRNGRISSTLIKPF
jgi:hypothetical protein